MHSEAQVLGPVVIVVAVDVVNLAFFWNVLLVFHHPDNAMLEVQVPADLHAAVVPFGRCLTAFTSSGGLPTDEEAVLTVEDEEAF